MYNFADVNSWYTLVNNYVNVKNLKTMMLVYLYTKSSLDISVDSHNNSQ